MSALSTTTTFHQATDGGLVTERERRLLSRERGDVAVAVCFGLVVFLLAWYRHYSYRSRTFDLAYFDQAIWLMAHGHMPFVTVIGRNIFADHFSPALVLFVPLYVIASTPVWLLAAQSAALGVGVLVLQPMLLELGLEKRWRVAFTIAYMGSPLLWNAALFDFHMSTLAVPFLFAGITAALRDELRKLAWLGLAILLLRDDLGLAVIGILLVGFLSSKHRRARLGFALVALAWVVIAGRFGQNVDSPALWRANYGYLGLNGADAIKHMGRTIVRAVAEIWSVSNLQTSIIWLTTLGFLPLLSPGRIVLGGLWLIPLMASPRFMNGSLVAFHHGVVILPFLLLAAATGLVRHRHRLIRVMGPPVLVAFALSSLWGYSVFPSWLFSVRAPARSLADKALRNIARTDGVTATMTLGPHLSHRTVLLPFPYPFVPGDKGTVLDESVTNVGSQAVARIDAVAVFVGADLSSAKVERAFFSSPLLRDFRLVFDEAGLLVYHRYRPAS